MAAQKRRNLGRRIASGLTSVFMSVAIVGQALALPNVPDEPPPTPPAANDDFCTQSITPEDLERLTGYTDIDDFRMASAYARYMQEGGADPRVIHAILEASEESGVDFKLMLVKAMIESSLGRYDRPLHVNGGARGLYQFLPATWLTVFSRFGAGYKNGQYAELAAAIKFESNGNPYVDDPELKQQILDLRSDFYVSAYMKAHQVNTEETPFLRNLTGREPTITDYYIVHFLGIPRARLFYRNLDNNPDRAAAPVMSKEARYNRPVFYNGRKARSFEQIYERLERIIKSRLGNAETVSDDILKIDDCTPPLERDAPPVAPAPLVRIAEFSFKP